MKRNTYPLLFAVGCCVFLMSVGKFLAADEPAKVGGTWEMTSESPRGTMTRTLTIQQDGSTIKGTMKSERGESQFEGSVTGNKISFTVKRETPNGAFTIEYSGTVDGDSMQGTAHSERFDFKWTAKRKSSASEK